MPDRIIKESCCTSETLSQLSDFEERFWWHLTVNCDDYGRFDARPAVLKGRLFPLAEGKTCKNMENALRKLASVGLVEVYEVDGRPFLQVVKWDKHQRIRAKRSKFPAPSEGVCCQLTANDSKCCRNPIQSNPNPIQSESNPTRAGSGEEDQFEVFWKAYPRKVSKQDARKAFSKAIGKVSLEAMLSALENQKKSPQWVRDKGQFIPHPTTWLNQERWDDEMEVKNGYGNGIGKDASFRDLQIGTVL